MSGFLYQIENRQKEMMNKDKRVRSTPKLDPSGAKTVGVKVPPDTYKKLAQLKEQRKLKSLKEAVLVAAEEGLRQLLVR